MMIYKGTICLLFFVVCMEGLTSANELHEGEKTQAWSSPSVAIPWPPFSWWRPPPWWLRPPSSSPPSHHHKCPSQPVLHHRRSSPSPPSHHHKSPSQPVHHHRPPHRHHKRRPPHSSPIHHKNPVPPPSPPHSPPRHHKNPVPPPPPHSPPRHHKKPVPPPPPPPPTSPVDDNQPPPERDPEDCSTALIYIDGCTRDLITSFFDQENVSVGRACCQAISGLSDNCFRNAFTQFKSPVFTRRIRGFCAQQH